VSNRGILALLALLLGLVAAVLLLLDVFQIGRNQAINFESLRDRALGFVIALVILFGSLIIYRGKYAAGGLLNVILGVVAFVSGYDRTAAALAVVSGLIGLVATQTKV